MKQANSEFLKVKVQGHSQMVVLGVLIDHWQQTFLSDPMLTKTKTAPYGTPVTLKTHLLGYQYTEKKNSLLGGTHALTITVREPLPGFKPNILKTPSPNRFEAISLIPLNHPPPPLPPPTPPYPTIPPAQTLLLTHTHTKNIFL